VAVTANKTTIKWHGPKVTRRIEHVLSRRLDQAAELVRSQIVRNLRSNQSWTKRPKDKKERWAAVWDYYAGKPSPYHPSKPGKIPHADTGDLSKRMFWDRKGKLTRRIGTPLKYGLWLQVGNRKIKPRPYLDVTLKQNFSKIRLIINQPIQK